MAVGDWVCSRMFTFLYKFSEPPQTESSPLALFFSWYLIPVQW